MADTSSASPEGAPPDLKGARRQRPRPAESLRTDRLPPHSLVAEQGVLGCALMAPGEALGRCLERFKHGAEVFYDLRHQVLFNALVELFDRHAVIDVVTVGQHLKDRNQLEAMGGFPYLSSLIDAVPSAASRVMIA